MPRFTEDYYKNTQGLTASPLLVQAIGSLVSQRKIALDLGAGSGRDTKFLLQSGFQVTAVDNEPSAEKYINELKPFGDVNFVHSTFADFDYKKYDLINARYALPFSPPDNFTLVMNTILESLNPGGVFVGQLFGTNDDWNIAGSNMTFLELSETQELLSSLEVLWLNEKDEEGPLANGSTKHWHVFDIIARKK